MYCVGRIVETEGVSLVDGAGHGSEIGFQGYDHFK